MSEPTTTDAKLQKLPDEESPQSDTKSQDVSEQEQTQQEKPFKSVVQEYTFIAIVCSVQLFVQSSLAQGIALINYERDTFGSTRPETTWYTAAYSLTIGTFIMVAGRLGDMYGKKNLFIMGTVWFGLWQLICGFSVYSNQIFFDVCRAMQGLGAAIMYPNATGLIGATYPNGNRKNMIMSLFGACSPNGFLLGATFSTLLAKYHWWPWSFWVSSILCMGLAVISYFTVPSSTNETGADKELNVQTNKKGVQLMEQIDVLGAVTGIAGLVLINFSLNQGGIVGWDVPYTYSLLIVGFIAFTAFYFVETRIASNPLVPFHKLSYQSVFGLACMGVGWSSFGLWIWYFWQFEFYLRHHNPLVITARQGPTGISGAIAALVVGVLMSRIGPGYVMLMSMLFFAVGNTLLATMPIDQIYWKNTFLTQTITPWGMDFSFPSACIILSAAMPREEQGNAASLVTTVQNYSIALGLGFAGTIESQLTKQGKSMLEVYRGTWYFAIGLDVLGIALAVTFVVLETLRGPKKQEQEQQQQQEIKEKETEGEDKEAISDSRSSSAISAMTWDEKHPPSIELTQTERFSLDTMRREVRSRGIDV